MASENIEKSSQELIYTVLGHTGLETSRIPLNPNSLGFNSREVNDRFTRRLIIEKDGSQKLSETVKNNLVLLYTTLMLFSLIVLVTAGVMCYGLNSESEGAFTVKVIAIATVDCVALGILMCVLTVSRLRLRALYLLFTLLLITYLVLCDQRVLSKFLSEELPREFVNHPLILALFLYMYSWVSLAHFLGMLIVSGYTLVLFLVFEIYSSDEFQLIRVSDFLFLAIFCALLCFRTHQTELRARHLFWRLEKEENAADVRLEIVDRRPSAGHTLNTERERLMELCESIKKKIKTAATVVIYKDIKSDLKTAVIEIEKVRRQLAIGHLNGLVGFDQDIDADDREFINQQIYSAQTSHPGTSQRLTLADRKASVISVPDQGNEELAGLLSHVGVHWNFDIWQVYKATGHSVRLVGKYLFQKWDFNAGLGISESVTDNFFREIENAYLKNPYHNACHAADVCHSLMYFVEVSGLFSSMTSVELGAAIIASLSHDMGHPGVTNRYLINNRDKMALRYNDTSVLENMHIALLYKVLNKPEFNILRTLPSDDWVASRKCIIDMVLHTDMSKHFETLGQFRARSRVPGDIDLTRTDDKYFVLSMGLKCADLGHTAKPTDLHQRWTDLVCEEFFNQGDQEKEHGQPVSMYCDRETADIPKSQAGFLKNISIPLFEAWLDYLDCPQAHSDCLEQQKANLMLWEGATRGRRGSDTVAKEAISAGSDKGNYSKHYSAVQVRPLQPDTSD